MNDAERG